VRLAAGAASNILSFPQNGAKVFAMRHRMRVAKLNRPADQRKALVRGLVTQVLRHGRITTTKVGPHAPFLLARGLVTPVLCSAPISSQQSALAPLPR